MLWRSSRNRSRTRRDTLQRLRRQLEEANARQAEYESQLEQEQEVGRRGEEEKRWAQEEKRKAEDARKRAAEEKRRAEEEARVLKGRLEEKEKQSALLKVGILKLKRKAENVGLELDGAKREVERRTEQLKGLVKQAAPFLELMRIDVDIDLPSSTRSRGSPPPSSSTAVQAHASSSSDPQPETDPDELLPKSLLTSLNDHISALSAKLADEGVGVIREVEDALDGADEWVDAMHHEEALSLEEASELEVDSDRDRDRGSPCQGRRASPQRPPRDVEDHAKGSKQAKATHTRSQIPVSSVYFPPTEYRLRESPRSLHEVELPPVGPPPRGPLPPIPPSPPRAPVPPPKSSAIPRPLSSVSDNRLRAPSSTSSQPRPFSAPVQASPPRQRASPPPALPLSAPTVQKPPRTTPPDLQQPPPTQYMYPYPYSNQQQPMGIPVSLAKGFASSATASARQSPSAAPLVLSGSTSTHRSTSPPSRSSSAASVLVPFPSSSSSSLKSGAGPSSISSAQWDRLGPYDRQVLLQAQRERAEREREARLEARRLAKRQARRERQAEREARRREREAIKAENEKRRKEEQGKREEAVEARVQAGEVFGEGLVGMVKEAGVRRGVFTEKVERKASTPTPKASMSGGKREGSGEGGSGDSGGGNGNGNGNGSGGEMGGKEEAKKDEAKDEDRRAKDKIKIDLHATLKLAFQTALCAYTHWMMCSWFFEDERGGVAAGNGTGDGGGHEGGEGLEGLLSEVYARVREGEEQLVSGLWRALTRKHVQRMLPGASSGSSSKRSSRDSEGPKKTGDGEDGGESEEEDDGRPDTLIEELCIYIIDALVNVLIVAGAHGGWYVGSGGEDSSEEEVEDVSEEGEEDDSDDDEDDGSEEDIIVFPTHSHPSQHTSPRPPAQQFAPTDEAGSAGGDYSISFDSDLYHDPYQGYSISQLSEFLSVTPTADTFKIGGRRGQTGQALAGNLLLPPHQVQSPNRPYTRSQSQSRSQLPTSSRPPHIQPQGPSVAPRSRPRPRRSRSATRLQAHSESTSKYTQEYLHAHLTKKFKAPLMRILKKARVLNKVLGEEVVRCDLEALYVAPGVGFVSDMMERGKVELVSKRVEADEQGKKGKGASKADMDVDVNDDGEDTPRPGSSPSSKKGPGSGKGSPKERGSQVTGSRETTGEREPPLSPDPPRSEGGSPSRAQEGEAESEEDIEDAEILCTTQLGLVRAEKVPRTRGEWDEVVLLKPVVVLVRDVT